MFEVPFERSFERNKFRGASDAKRSAVELSCVSGQSSVSATAYPLQYLLIRLFYLAQVLPKPVFIHRFSRRLIPKPAGVWGNLIGQNEPATMNAKLELEIDKDHPAFGKERLQDAIYV